MRVSELLAKSYLIATGKSATLAEGDKNWTKLLQYANIFQQAWATEVNSDWQTLYEDVDNGTISATDTFDLDDSIQRISNRPGDYIRIEYDNRESTYELVSASELNSREDNVCARLGSTLKFGKAFTSESPEFGGALIIPAYIYPEDLESANDRVVVDDPNWLVFMCAAEWVRNDLTLAQNYPNIIALANNSMQGMKSANQPQSRQMQKSPAMRGIRSW